MNTASPPIQYQDGKAENAGRMLDGSHAQPKLFELAPVFQTKLPGAEMIIEYVEGEAEAHDDEDSNLNAGLDEDQISLQQSIEQK